MNTFIIFSLLSECRLTVNSEDYAENVFLSLVYVFDKVTPLEGRFSKKKAKFPLTSKETPWGETILATELRTLLFKRK